MLSNTASTSKGVGPPAPKVGFNDPSSSRSYGAPADAYARDYLLRFPPIRLVILKLFFRIILASYRAYLLLLSGPEGGGSKDPRSSNVGVWARYFTPAEN